MKKLVRIVGYTILFIVLASGATALAFIVMARSRVPHVDGEITDPALTAPVTITRDTWGVPHIKAENETDAYFALGLAMAQDRLFQMEALRRVARGQIAEAFGPSFVPVDKILRCFQLGRQADALFENPEGFSPEILAAMDAFVAGINHIVDEPNHLPFEFAMVRINPRPFTKADCVAVAAVLPVTFAEGLREDALATVLKGMHPDLDTDAFFPGYRHEVPVTIMESLSEAESILKERTSTNTADSAEITAGQTGLAFLRAWLEALEPLQQYGSALGSNSWVLSGANTASGRPILANDPHIGFTNPSIWYEAHVQYGDVENYGWYLPPVAFPLLAHNRDRAWAITMFENDDVDLYLEEFDPADPTKVKYKGAWTDVEVVEDSIAVRWGADVPYTLRTTPHGPVVSDMLEAFGIHTDKPVALRWLWQHVPRTDLAAFYEMSHANDLETFGHAVAKLTSPGLNISYADAEGNIAWWAAGLLPIRPAHVNPKSLLDGASGNDEILGYVPFEQNPKLINPPDGVIVTANNLSTVRPVGDLTHLDGYWQPSDRAARIKTLLAERHDWTVEALKAVQTDVISSTSPAIVAALEACFAARGSYTEDEMAVCDAIRNWDQRHEADSTGATAYQTLCDAIMIRAWSDEMGADLLAAYGGVADSWNFFKYAVTDDAAPFWDDIDTPETETREDIVHAAVSDTATLLHDRLGPDPTGWTWGRVHQITFTHPLGMVGPLGSLFNIGPFPQPGGDEVINALEYDRAQHDYSIQSGPSTRRLIDFAEPEQAQTILPTGNSGNFVDPHYADQAPLFTAGEYRTAWIADSDIAAHTEHVLTVKPGPRPPQ